MLKFALMGNIYCLLLQQKINKPKQLNYEKTISTHNEISCIGNGNSRIYQRNGRQRHRTTRN